MVAFITRLRTMQHKNLESKWPNLFWPQDQKANKWLVDVNLQLLNCSGELLDQFNNQRRNIPTAGNKTSFPKIVEFPFRGKISR